MGKRIREIFEIKTVKVLGILALAFILSLLMMQPFSISTATLLSSNDRSDFSITDFYNIVANSRKVKAYEQEIAIINIAQCDRNDIATILSLINECPTPPRAVGLDVIFEHPKEDDSRLLAEIARTPNLVLASVLQQEPDTSAFNVHQKSFFEADYPNIIKGAVNFPTKYEKSVIRKFPSDFHLVDGQEMPSFAKAVAITADHDCANDLKDRGNKDELINFPSVEFLTIEPGELMSQLDNLGGKVVLIGDLNDESDMHVTPITPRMAGVEIHAHAIRTILRHDYLNPLSKFQNWSIGIALALLIIWLSVTIPVGIKGLVLRIIQFLLLFVIIPVGYYFFVEHNLSIDFTCAFLMVTFSLFAADIWIGLSNMPEILSPYIKMIQCKMKTFSVYVRKAFFFVIILIIGSAACHAKYTLHNFTGKVSIERKGQDIEVQKGMELMPMDNVNIGPDGEVEILNSFDSRIYTSVSYGNFTVNRILIDAEAHSKDNNHNVFSNMSVKRSSKTSQVYVDKGAVSRTLVVYDPENENRELDCHKLGASLLHWFDNRSDTASFVPPLQIKRGWGEQQYPLAFEFTNTLDFPVYFNVIKIKDPQSRYFEISDIGQPLGCYVVPPKQAIMRSTIEAPEEGESHMLLMTHYYFDIDKLLLCVEELLESPLGVPEPPDQAELPMYIFPL